MTYHVWNSNRTKPFYNFLFWTYQAWANPVRARPGPRGKPRILLSEKQHPTGRVLCQSRLNSKRRLVPSVLFFFVFLVHAPPFDQHHWIGYVRPREVNVYPEPSRSPSLLYAERPVRSLHRSPKACGRSMLSDPSRFPRSPQRTGSVNGNTRISVIDWQLL